MGHGQGVRSFVEEDLAGARFERCDLSGAVVRGSAVGGLEVDDPWLGRPGEVLVVNGVDVVPLVEAELDRRFPGGLLHAEFATDGFDVTGFTDPPSYDAVLAVRAERVAMVRDHLAALDDADLGAPALHVWAPDVPRAVLQSLHTILAEEWEHLRYALRDLAAVEEAHHGPRSA